MKVGRRSHSSFSRRRLRNKKSYKKNSYRKKYTQKGGCWGTSKKGGARGRKYKRARTHTHKRGKRFHRGGFKCNNQTIVLTPLYKKRDGTQIETHEKSSIIRKYFSYTTPEIFYKKIGPIGPMFATGRSSKFDIYVDFIITGDNVDLVIEFTRLSDENNSPTFVFKKTGNINEVKNFLDTMVGNEQSESNEKHTFEGDNEFTLIPKVIPNPPRKYSFKSGKNEVIFKEIASCINSAIQHVTSANVNILPPTISRPTEGEEDDDLNPTTARRNLISEINAWEITE
jgi:hypothetical protein